MDLCIELMSLNKDNASIFLYGLKVLQNYRLTINAKENLIKTAVSLSLLYPYIVPLLDQHIFIPYAVDSDVVEKYINFIYNQYSPKQYHEACAYALYYATKYNTKIQAFNIDDIIEKNDSILLLIALIYCRKKHDDPALAKLTNHAKHLKDNDELEEYWPFVYECLTTRFLTGDWKPMKQAKVSFLKTEYR